MTKAGIRKTVASGVGSVEAEFAFEDIPGLGVRTRQAVRPDAAQRELQGAQCRRCRRWAATVARGMMLVAVNEVIDATMP